jgi:uncharacterized protein YbaP (TraB family)
MMEKLFYERNANWVKKVDEYIKNNKVYFMNVGAGHLVGEKSLITSQSFWWI